MPLHHIIDFPSGFDLFPVIQFAFLCDYDKQEIPSCTMRMFVFIEQVYCTFDV